MPYLQEFYQTLEMEKSDTRDGQKLSELKQKFSGQTNIIGEGKAEPFEEYQVKIESLNTRGRLTSHHFVNLVDLVLTERFLPIFIESKSLIICYAPLFTLKYFKII